MHPLVELVKETVERYVSGAEIPEPKGLTAEMKARSGVFVTIYMDGGLRGCIGTFLPTRGNVAEEAISNAVSAASRDFRFSPVTADELPRLSYKVDILSRPELVDSEAQLDPKRFGVIVEHGARRGLLLPDLDGVDTVEQQLAIARAKGGIGLEQPVRIFRFEVRRLE